MAPKLHRTGFAPSGDVSIFFRRFGNAAGTPIIILHGSNYYDSYDWIDVAHGLGQSHETVAFDSRGYGQSTWSSSKDYSHDSQVADAAAVLDHLGWKRAVIMGHSRGGAYATIFAARHPDRTAALVLVDHCPGIGVRGGGPPITSQMINQQPRVFLTLDAALASMSWHEAPEGSAARERLKMFMRPIEGGFIIGCRDPDYSNPIPISPAGWAPKIAFDVDVWAELTKVRAPTLVFRGLRSPTYTPEALARMRAEFPNIKIIDVDSGHDVAPVVPSQLIDETSRFISEHVDGKAA